MSVPRELRRRSAFLLRRKDLGAYRFGEWGVFWRVRHQGCGRGYNRSYPAGDRKPRCDLAATKEEVSRCRAIQQPVQRRDCFGFLKKGPKAKAEEAAKAKTENAPSPPAPDVATTSTVDRVNVAPGQPICVDRDALGAMLAAGVLASSPSEATTNGCQTIPEDAKVELLEMFSPGIFWSGLSLYCSGWGSPGFADDS